MLCYQASLSYIFLLARQTIELAMMWSLKNDCKLHHGPCLPVSACSPNWSHLVTSCKLSNLTTWLIDTLPPRQHATKVAAHQEVPHRILPAQATPSWSDHHRPPKKKCAQNGFKMGLPSKTWIEPATCKMKSHLKGHASGWRIHMAWRISRSFLDPCHYELMVMPFSYKFSQVGIQLR